MDHLRRGEFHPFRTGFLFVFAPFFLRDYFGIFTLVKRMFFLIHPSQVGNAVVEFIIIEVCNDGLIGAGSGQKVCSHQPVNHKMMIDGAFLEIAIQFFAQLGFLLLNELCKFLGFGNFIFPEGFPAFRKQRRDFFFQDIEFLLFFFFFGFLNF